MSRYERVDPGNRAYTCRLTPFRKGRVEIDGKRFRVDWVRPIDSIDPELMKDLKERAIATALKFLKRNRELPNLVIVSALNDVWYSRADIVPSRELHPKRDRPLSGEGICSLLMAQNDKDGKTLVGDKLYSINWTRRASESIDGDLEGKMVREAIKCAEEFRFQNNFWPSSVYSRALESIGAVYSRAE